MNTEDVFYFDGSSARPSPVRVLLFNEQVHLRKDGDEGFTESFPAVTTTQNQIGSTLYIYLDPSGTRYLQLHADHPAATLLSHEQANKKSNWAQRLMKQRSLVLLFVTLGLGLCLYFLLVSLVPFLGMRMIGVQQEITMGRHLKDAMLKQSGIIGETVDSAGTVHLQQFAGGLRLSSQYPIEVTLLKSKTINAYALPGGQIVVYSGIVEKMKTPEELVALLAHEATHINERHSLRSLLRSAASGILISVVFGDASGISGAVISGAETLQGLQYSRTLEAEADRKGMELMLANGLDAKGMKQLMQTLQQEEKLPNDLSFISSHPLTNERIKAAERYTNEHPQTKQKKEDLQLLFDSIQSRAAAR
jgi:Zn-dependent protease with chaperone function